ncbi:MAG: hypothetical protein U0793_30745 [Gemmataceae bacterium]
MSQASNVSGEAPKRPYAIRKQVAPLISVDCSEWGRLLEVAFPAPHESGAGEAAACVDVVLDAVDTLDVGHGGSKFRLIEQKAVGANIVLTLAPIQPDNAKERIQHVIDALPGALARRVPISYAKVA